MSRFVRTHLILISVATIILIEGTVWAAAVAFSSKADGLWDAAGTWNAVPLGDHDFPVSGDATTSSHTVTLPSDQTTGTLNLQGGQLSLDGHVLTVESAGQWTGGTLHGGTLDQNGTWALAGAGQKSLVFGLLDNSGTMNHGGTGSLGISEGAVLQNSGTYDLQSTGGLVAVAGGSGAAPLFENTNMMLKSGAGSTSVGVNLTNSGTLDVTAGVLVLSGISIHNTGGVIQANGGNINLGGGASIIGGTVTSTGSSRFVLGDSQVFQGVVNEGLLRINSNTAADIGGSGMTNNGTVEVGNSASAIPTLNFSSNFAVDGTGAISMSDSVAQLNTSANVVLTNTTGHEIRGRGTVNGAVHNEGTIRPAGGNLNLTGTAKSNTGTIVADGGRTLSISSMTLDNTDGLILADGGTVAINAARVISGELNSSNGGVVSGSNSTIENVSNSGHLRVASNTIVSVDGATLVNNGLIEVGADISATPVLRADADVAISGTGVIDMTDSNAQMTHANAGRFRNAAGHTIRGRGTIIASLDNDGLVRSTDGTLALSTEPKSNTGTLQADAGHTLAINSMTLTNTGGLIVADGGTVAINASRVIDGELNSSNGGLVTGSNSTIEDVTNLGDFRVLSNTVVGVDGTVLVNQGRIEVGRNISATPDLRADADIALKGSGLIDMTDSNAHLSSMGGGKFRNLIGHTIRGRGKITGVLENDGLVFSSNGTLELTTESKANTGLFTTAVGTELQVNSITLDNHGGDIVADEGTVRLSNATVEGGILDSVGAGLVIGVNSVLTDVTNLGSLRVQPNTTIGIAGAALTNNGMVEVGAGISATPVLRADADVLLQGTGTINMSDSNATVAASPGGKFTNVAGHQIRGRGQIHTPLHNSGTLAADGGTLRLHTAPMSNSGTLAARSGAELLIDSELDNTGGAVVADDGTVRIRGTTVQGGTLDVLSGGIVIGENATLQDVTNNGLLRVASNQVVAITGAALTNMGTVELGAGASATPVLRADAAVTLSGAGEIVMQDSNSKLTHSTGNAFTNAAGHTVRGRGTIEAVFTNDGTVLADHTSTLNISPAAAPGFINTGVVQVSGSGGLEINNPAQFFNQGDVIVDATRLLTVNGTYRQAAGDVRVDGELRINGGGIVDLRGGTLSGNGLIKGNVTSDGGRVAPGASAGTLTIQGNYNQHLMGGINVDLGGVNPGEFDVLSVTGAARLCGGTLRIVLINGFMPADGDSFQVLTGPNVSGDFSAIVGQCFAPGMYFDVVTVAGGVTLTAVAGACPIRIMDSSPASGLIDARQNVAIIGTPTYGWDTVTLTFDGDASALTAADFSVVSTAGVAPAVLQVLPHGNEVTVVLDGFIPIVAWTTIRHVGSHSAVSLGYLPSDANADRVANAQDIISIINHLNGVFQPPMNLWQCDVNHSGGCNAQDITRLIDVLNGAGALDPMVSQSLPACVLP